MEVDVPIYKHSHSEIQSFLVVQLSELAKSCSRKIDTQFIAQKMAEVIRTSYKNMYHSDIDSMFTNFMNGEYGVPRDTKIDYLAIFTWLDEYNKSKNLKSKKEKKDDLYVDSLNLLKLFEDEPNSKYCFPYLYVVNNGKTYNTTDGICMNADAIEAEGLKNGLVKDCVCTFKDKINKAFLNTNNKWQCPFCGAIVDRSIYDFSEDVDILDSFPEAKLF